MRAMLLEVLGMVPGAPELEALLTTAAINTLIRMLSGHEKWRFSFFTYRWIGVSGRVCYPLRRPAGRRTSF
jgi:hypothetical protein